MTDSVSCSMFSKKIFFRGTWDADHFYIDVHGNGNIIAFHTKKDSFDPNNISKFGIRAGTNAAIFGPKFVSPNLASFSLAQSEIISEQLFKSDNFTIQVAFFPEFELVNKKLHTGIDENSFQSVFMSKKYCELIKNSDGWVGIYMQDLPDDPIHIELVKKYSKFSNPGVLVWSAHPKKQGSISGLEAFDLILGVNSQPVNSSSLGKILQTIEPGEEVKLNILRGRKSARTIKLTRPLI